MTKIIDALGPKLQTYMDSLSVGKRGQMLNKINSQADAFVAQINSMTIDQLMSLVGMAASSPSTGVIQNDMIPMQMAASSPSTGVIQNDMIPMQMAASPSGLVGMNMSSPAMAMKSDQLKMQDQLKMEQMKMQDQMKMKMQDQLKMQQMKMQDQLKMMMQGMKPARPAFGF
jgi:hypothetical protein